MDHVLRGEDHDDRPAHRHVQLVADGEVIRRAELAVRARIRDLPLELLGVNRDRVGVGRNAVAALDLFPVVVAHEPQRDDGDRRNRGPHHLGLGVAVRVVRFAARPPPVLDHEPDQPRFHDHEGEPRDDQDREEQAVDLGGERRPLERQPPGHGAVSLTER